MTTEYVALKLEVGKTYTTKSGAKVFIRFKSDYDAPHVNTGYFFVGEALQATTSPAGMIGRWSEQGWNASGNASLRLVSEYKEPVTHRRDVIWVRNSHTKELTVTVTSVEDKLKNSWQGWSEIHRETVQYTEEE